MNNMVLPLNSDLPIDSQYIGGKACGLGHLCRLKANVPLGFVIPAGVKWNKELKIEINTFLKIAIKKCGENTLFAIRSSATIEDGDKNSYAGIFDTLLNVPQENVFEEGSRLINAEKSCRLKNYHRVCNTKDDIGCDNIAIVVQRMVNPTLSGVFFTANPITGSKNEVIVEVASGLGEKIVSGQVTPNYYCFDFDGNMIAFEKGDDTDETNAFSSNHIEKIICAANKINMYFDKPMDVEFAFDCDELYLLQARPITTV